MMLNSELSRVCTGLSGNTKLFYHDHRKMFMEDTKWFKATFKDKFDVLKYIQNNPNNVKIEYPYNPQGNRPYFVYIKSPSSLYNKEWYIPVGTVKFGPKHSNIYNIIL